VGYFGLLKKTDTGNSRQRLPWTPVARHPPRRIGGWIYSNDVELNSIWNLPMDTIFGHAQPNPVFAGEGIALIFDPDIFTGKNMGIPVSAQKGPALTAYLADGDCNVVSHSRISAF
jgi:hypothetical protein